MSRRTHQGPHANYVSILNSPDLQAERILTIKGVLCCFVTMQSTGNAECSLQVLPITTEESSGFLDLYESNRFDFQE